MTPDDDELWMWEALLAGRRVQGLSYPNPPVGAALVNTRQLVATGSTQVAGGAHAEIMCLNAAGSECVGATLFVTLEPCDHIGRTGRCSEAIIAAGVERVVVCLTDPNPKTNGSGIARLKSAGINVRLGVLAEVAGRDIGDYLWRVQRGYENGVLK